MKASPYRKNPSVQKSSGNCAPISGQLAGVMVVLRPDSIVYEQPNKHTKNFTFIFSFNLNFPPNTPTAIFSIVESSSAPFPSQNGTYLKDFGRFSTKGFFERNRAR